MSALSELRSLSAPRAPRSSNPRLAGVDVDAAQRAVADLLRACGVDARGPVLADTPRRVAETFAELFAGVGRDAAEPLRRACDAPPGLDVVCLRGIDFRSVCAHHLLPFSGTVGIAYAPTERIAGLGSFVESLEILSARPQLQEQLAGQLAEAVCAGLDAAGAVVEIVARHSCVADRGARQGASELVTVAAWGSMRDPERQRDALAALRGR